MNRKTATVIELSRWIAETDLALVSRKVGASRESITRFVAGMPVRPGTRVLIEIALQARAAEEREAAKP